MLYIRFLLFVIVFVLASSKCQSWNWFSSSKETHSNDNPSSTKNSISSSVAEFSMEAFNNHKGIRMVEEAKIKLIGPSSCWQNAYQHLFSGCSEIFAVDEKRSRFAWYLSDCFQRDSGRPPFPFCDQQSGMPNCLKILNEYEHSVYLEFYLETNSICHQLQAHVFKKETERLVNELISSAQYAEDKLELIEEKSDHLLQGSKQIYDSLNSIDHRTQQVARTAKNVEDHIDIMLKQSAAVHEQSKKLASSQVELQEGQIEMKKNLKEGMEILQDSYTHLGDEIENLRNEAIEIEKEITKVGEAMSEKMKYLQSKADDIGNMAGESLDKQQKLLDGQTTALLDLQLLTRYQTEALEESRNSLKRLAEYGSRQQEELLRRQKQLQQVHDHLMDNSKSILAAQESFESKQASMFIALDKLFVLHNAMLLESRLIKAFFIYCASIFIIYMFTSTKQTYTVRPWLYIGLCATFSIEVAILRFTASAIERKTWIINLVRSSFVLLASTLLVHTICTYRDYEVLNYHMLQTLIEKVNCMQRKELTWDTDSEVNWSSWIDSDIPEDVNDFEDPDYIVQVISESIQTWLFVHRLLHIHPVFKGKQGKHWQHDFLFWVQLQQA